MWKSIAFDCVAGHLQCQAQAKQLVHSDNRLPGLPDISLLSAELQQQWDTERNLHLGALKVKPNSNTMAVWQCKMCPAGQPHIWTARISNRARGARCPYCNNRLVCLHNSLATKAPDVARYWNHSKNDKTPDQVVAGSRSRAEWKCPTCQSEWQAAVGMRVVRKAGCPKCSHQNKSRQSQPTFAEAQPACLAEWDYEHNDAKDIYPDNTTLGSSKLVHWICSCCPRGQPHRWTARPYARVGHGQGCAVCAGRQACVCNSLASLFTSVAAEFDVDKNGFGPCEITSRSRKRVWWKNAQQASWRQRVDDRTQRRQSSIQQV